MQIEHKPQDFPVRTAFSMEFKAPSVPCGTKQRIRAAREGSFMSCGLQIEAAIHFRYSLKTETAMSTRNKLWSKQY